MLVQVSWTRPKVLQGIYLTLQPPTLSPTCLNPTCFCNAIPYFGQAYHSHHEPDFTPYPFVLTSMCSLSKQFTGLCNTMHPGTLHLDYFFNKLISLRFEAATGPTSPPRVLDFAVARNARSRNTRRTNMVCVQRTNCCYVTWLSHMAQHAEQER